MGAGDGLVEIQPEELRFTWTNYVSSSTAYDGLFHDLIVFWEIVLICMDYKWLEFKASTLNNGAVKEEPIHEKPMSKETDISSDQALSGLADYNSTHVAKDIDEFKLKLNSLEVKLNDPHQMACYWMEHGKVSLLWPMLLPFLSNHLFIPSILEWAEKTITNLRGENSAANLLREKFLHEIAVVRRKRASRVEVGFSILSVVCVALVGTSLGYLSRSLGPSGNSSMD
ncbi:uncharacterized protein LOC103994208 isoform X1 [Musa acuminata AAA Group]|uniref:uncharacterized protein LOC103994208 isoform X1 n=1 Tax=Musa acuminata AAA Group TaxID=214697 RepID=UPI0008A0B8F0|nr:PREDICTED: uncharacterized protein LOC103994208 isoform X1 [Musa acuminata subsp. malaccensis]